MSFLNTCRVYGCPAHRRISSTRTVLQRQRQGVDTRLVDRRAQGVADEIFPDVLAGIP